MKYQVDLQKAARRHLKAAQVLYDETGAGAQPGCKAVAGYLFGLAGELAVKVLMRDSGVNPIAQHFPKLKSTCIELHGRRSGELRKLLDDARLFQNWDIAMRYAPTKDIDPDWIPAWKTSAEDLVGRIGTG